MKLHLILCCLCISHFIYSQSTLPEFGFNTSAEINLKECAFDKNAGAVVLFDEAFSDHDDEWHLNTRRRIRIKIFDQKESDQGNIRIRFYSKDKFEFISNIRGVTTNYDNGQAQISTLDKKSIYTEKEDALYSVVKFAMPGVKAGSIIEYEYESHKEHYGGLRPWIFQNEIPTLRSCYLLTLLPGTEFQYSVQKKMNYPIIITPNPDVGQVYFEMDNIPGLKFEPYMDAVRDYLQRVEFQLASYTARGSKNTVNQTWGDLARELMSDRDFAGVIKKDLPNMDQIKNIVAKESDDSAKITAIYDFVRKNFTCTRDYGIYATEGLKSAWEKRAGSVAEINLILLNLLQTFNIESSPLLVAERDFGKIDTLYPFIDRFNKVVAYARVNGKSYIMDATQKYCTAELVPYPLLNTIAFVVDKKDYRLIRILGRGHSYENSITANARIDSKGRIEGEAEIVSNGYARQLRTEEIKEDPKKFIRNVLQETGSDLMVDDFQYDNLGESGKPLVQKVKFHNESDASGGFIFFNYNMFTGFVKNPFTADERFTNVNFGYPLNIRLSVTLQLPDKAKIDKLPSDKNVSSNDGLMYVYRAFKKENNTLRIEIGFRQNVTLVGYDQYAQLKELYTRITGLLNEPVVLKITE